MTAAAEFSRRLLEWFDVHGRHGLPWQREPTPYRVWVSEVMLQQTQVATVIPYFERFMARFPSILDLAQSPVDEVMHLWTGLGYYARARNLQACARAVVAQHGGIVPRDLEALLALPGIGRSTAGAILALSGGLRFPILDGNVKRVLARTFGIEGDPGAPRVAAALWRLAEECTPNERVAAYTQAIMDLGATLCTRARPACTVCPMNTLCRAAREGRQKELPGRRPRRPRPTREAVMLLVESSESGESGGYHARAVLLERRPASGIWGGLWSPPQFDTERAALEWCRRELGQLHAEGDADGAAGDGGVAGKSGVVRDGDKGDKGDKGDDGVGRLEYLPTIVHAFTHFELHLKPLRMVREAGPGPAVRDAMEGGAPDRLWYPLDAPPRIGLPQPIRQLLERLGPARMG